MKKARKALLTLCAALLLVSVTAGMTIAYLTDEAAVKNTFTVGKIDIKLDETKVDINGDPLTGDDAGRSEGTADTTLNTYKIMPGEIYTKDPTVWVKTGSEESFIRLLVKITDITELKAAFGDDFLPQDYVDWNSDKWLTTNEITPVDGEDAVIYEFRYHKAYTAPTSGEEWNDLEPLFTTITIPSTVDETDLAKLNEANVNIVITAEAIQAQGFDGDEDAAWEAFKKQD